MNKNISANLYQVGIEDSVLKCNCTAGATKLVLPSASTNKEVTAYKTDSSANAVTIHVPRGEVLTDGTLQVETATVVGTITDSGNAAIVLTSALVPNGSITLSVPVLKDDTPEIVAAKICGAFKGNQYIADPFTGAYTVSYVAGVITMKTVEYVGNDSTLNISIDNDTCTGLTTAATSTSTTSGVAVTLATQNEYKTLSAVSGSWSVTDASGANSSETLTNKTIDSSLNYMKNTVLAYAGRVTTAQLNAGITLVAAVTGRTIRVLGYSLVSNGDFSSGGGTSVIFQDTNGTPVVITTVAKAALTAGAKIGSGMTVANVTDGAGMVGNLTASKGIAIKADAALSVGTSIDIVMTYMYV